MPRGRPPKSKEESPMQTVEPKEEKEVDLQREIMMLKQEKEQLERKLEKRKAPVNIPTQQHRCDEKMLDEIRKEDNKKVRGVFRCLKPPGGNVTFYFRKYKKDPVEKYQLFDGQEYELPKSVVKHLNEDCYEEDKSFLLDANGEKIKGSGKKHYRFSFNVKV